MIKRKKYKMKAGICGILESWNPEVDIDDYRVGKDGRLEIDYYLDDKETSRIAPETIAGWYGGKFVKWKYDDKGSLDGMIIEVEREVEA